MKGLLHRRERPPQAVVDLLGDGERVLSWADTADGDVVVATSYGLWWPGSGSGAGSAPAGTPAQARLIPWQRIVKVLWQDQFVLTVIEADVQDDALLVDRPAVYARLSVPRDLPPTVRKRVEQNIVRSELLAAPGGGVRFVARKQPGRDGLIWWARLEPGTPATDELLRAVHARLATLRAGT